MTLVVAILASMVGYLAFLNVQDSDYLQLKTIRVEGTETLTPERVVEISGLTNEDNILFVRTSSIRGRLIAEPYIEKCRVARIFPDMVSIKIVERKVAAALMAHNRVYAIDPEGIVLQRLEPGAIVPGPMITEVPELGTVEVGGIVRQRALMEAMEVWKAFCATQMSKEVTVSELAAHAPNDIRMYCDELRYEIRWGRGDYESQAKRLDVLWREKKGCLPCLEYLDVRFGRDLACK
ncbi:MAG: FtsQ-type POTRA domain-containing protein [Candidatus Hydrogenedentes bacterium]|nr:FtsQ-type POTRA domain-containing protein [Candidatus Hydrogenedentota bacterium]